MGKIAFVFSGQGDQFPGMGREFAGKYKAADSVYEMCDRIRPGTLSQCQNGTQEELKETENTQPCLFAFELAAAKSLEEKGLRPSAVAGFSLGEVVAAAYSGIFGYDEGFKLVCRRGKLMQEEAEKYDTAMAAAVKLTAEQVQVLCQGFPDIYPVNFNAPGQVAVAGLTSQMADFSAEVKKAGGRAVPLRVKGAFHSPFMEKAAEAFAEELKKARIKKADIAIYSDLTAELYTEDVIGLLSRQICSPVQWEKLIRNMIADGIGAFIEIGPGKTLVNLIKRISPDVRALSVTECLAGAELC